MNLPLTLSIGLITGMLGGMLGIGGGVVMIPAMVLLMGVDQHTAQGVSLMVVVILGLVGAFTHYRQNNVRLDIALWLIPGAVLFAFLGVWVAGQIEARWLTKGFALFLLVVGGLMVLPRR
mgnify:CR=1 FL=1